MLCEVGTVKVSPIHIQHNNKWRRKNERRKAGNSNRENKRIGANGGW